MYRPSSREVRRRLDLEGLMDPVLFYRSGNEGRPAPATDKPPTGSDCTHKAGGAGCHRQPGRHIQCAHARPLPSWSGGQHPVLLCSRQWQVVAYEDVTQHPDIAAVHAVSVTRGDA